MIDIENLKFNQIAKEIHQENWDNMEIKDQQRAIDRIRKFIEREDGITIFTAFEELGNLTRKTAKILLREMAATISEDINELSNKIYELSNEIKDKTIELEDERRKSIQYSFLIQRREEEIEIKDRIIERNEEEIESLKQKEKLFTQIIIAIIIFGVTLITLI